MKKMILASACLCLAMYASAQSMLHDAKILSAFFNAPSAASQNRASIKSETVFTKEALQVLVKYLPRESDTSTEGLVDNFDNIFGNNPFIRLQITSQNLPQLDRSGHGIAAEEAAFSPKGFSVTGFADGLSRFLVKRTKQELSQTFFQEFKQRMNSEPLLLHFCPATHQHLEMIDQDVYQFNKYLQGMRDAFVMDMTALPGNTETYLRDPGLCPDCAAKPTGKIMIDFMHLSQQIADGEAPIDMIDYMAQPVSAIQGADASEPVLYNMAGAFRFLNLISKSLRNPESEDPMLPWYTAAEIRELFKDPTLMRLYMGLLWQKSGDITILVNGGNQIGLQSILGQAAEATVAGNNLFEHWRNILEILGGNVHSVQLSVRANADTPASGADDFFRFSECLNQLLVSVNRVGQAVLQQSNGSELIPEEYLFYMRQCNALYFNVRQRNYSGAISNVIFCLGKMKGDKDEIALMLKYANFAAAIAEANSPEEIEQAIDLYALPAGSSAMKKQPGRFALALNAYTGLSAGVEYLDGRPGPKTIGAVAAPLGLSFSWGLGAAKQKENTSGASKPENRGSLGFFIPLIDVGAVTAYRFKDNTSENLPELTWNNIISPGLYVVYDVPGKLPLALGYGAQIGPSLRKVDELGQTVNKSGWRHGLFAAVDIPITYFYLGKGKKN